MLLIPEFPLTLHDIESQRRKHQAELARLVRDDHRAKLSYSGRPLDDQSLIPETMTVPVERLFNVSAYKPGDLQRFFRDPRSREQYLPWAMTLVLAEKFHEANPQK